MMFQNDEFVKVCKYSELQEKQGKQFFVDDVEIALIKVDGKVYALSNICPHQKTHLIHEGFVEDGKITCPIHGWQFDLSTGNLAEGRKGLDSYEVKIIGEDVLVKAVKKSFNW